MTADQYFKDHGVNPDYAKSMGLSWDDQEIHIPIKDAEGNTIFSKHRNLHYSKDNPESAKYRSDSGSRAALFNYHVVKGRPYVVICEGEIDSVRLNQEGIPSVSSTGGSQKFDQDWSTLLESTQTFVCYDSDFAGQSGVKKVLELLPEAKVIQLPNKYKDVCDFFVDGHNKADFIALMRKALTKEEWERVNRPEDYARISAQELANMMFPPEQWLVDKIIYKEGFCFIYGAEGTGKSFITLSLAQAVASGTDWLGQFKVPQAGKVMFIDKENPKPMLARRLKALGMDSPNITWIKYPDKLQLVDEKGQVTPFAQALADDVVAEGIQMIVIDSFVDLMVGNENAASDTQMFFDTMRALFPNVAMVVIHHENKPSQGVFRSDSQRARGSSNISAQTVTQFRLEAVAKSKTDLTLKQTKARDAQKIDKFMVRMVVATNEDGATQVTGFEYVGIVAGDIDEKTDEARATIEEMLSVESLISRKEIIELCQNRGISESTVRRSLKKMLEDEIIDETSDPQNKSKKNYFLINAVKIEEDGE